jgi:hypothetical protein
MLHRRHLETGAGRNWPGWISGTFEAVKIRTPSRHGRVQIAAAGWSRNRPLERPAARPDTSTAVRGSRPRKSPVISWAPTARHIAQRYIAALTALERKLRQAWRIVQQSRIEFRSITEEINTRVQVLRIHLSFFRAHSVKALRFELPCKIAADCHKCSKARRRSGTADGAQCVARWRH